MFEAKMWCFQVGGLEVYFKGMCCWFYKYPLL